MLGATPAAASPGTIGNSDGTQGAHSESDSNDASGHRREGRRRHNGPHKPRTGDVTTGAVRPGSGVASGPRQSLQPADQMPSGASHPDYPSWHNSAWPCLPLPQFPPIVLPPLPPLPPLPLPPLYWPRAAIGDGVGVPAPPSARIASPPEAAGGGGGSGGLIDAAPRTIPPPGEPGEPGEPPVISASSGAVGPAGIEPPPITMPPLIGLPPVFEAPMRPLGPGAEPGPRSGPGRESAQTRERPPATSAAAGTEVPPSSRVGYPKYLQDAKIGEVAAVALPGFAGLLALTGFGGFLGYRQAKAGHLVRAAGTTRFTQ
ncbi:hypothetical protein [Mycolicibacterium sp. P1-5]|uniref:hypothetical protein n=1 Tax=Mycolicibacterium sp. P1-5 TaxID=2024617 RepID=UPI0011EBA0B2|nr:hypothetical protein [Mycolicibacterium sp. P1-5]KAA0105600.1 hypothetical protein CIW47_19590 [Mycolicibacterium sp. P1-5]